MSYRRLLDEGLAERSLEVTPVLEMGSARLICSLIGEGAGISFLPDYVTEQDVQAGAIVRLNVRDFEVEISFFIIGISGFRPNWRRCLSIVRRGSFSLKHHSLNSISCSISYYYNILCFSNLPIYIAIYN